MSKIKLNKNFSKRGIALVMTGFMVSSGFVGCKKNTENNETENSTFEEIVEPVDDYAEIKDIVQIKK